MPKKRGPVQFKPMLRKLKPMEQLKRTQREEELVQARREWPRFETAMKRRGEEPTIQRYRRWKLTGHR